MIQPYRRRTDTGRLKAPEVINYSYIDPLQIPFAHFDFKYRSAGM